MTRAISITTLALTALFCCAISMGFAESLYAGIPQDIYTVIPATPASGTSPPATEYGVPSVPPDYKQVTPSQNSAVTVHQTPPVIVAPPPPQLMLPTTPAVRLYP